jgi:uncharacterized protein
MQHVSALTQDWSATQQSVPVRAKERIQAIDVLRGLALFGVLMVNLVTVFRVSIFQQFLPQAADVPVLDHLANGFVSTFLESKMISLFSLLFGVGLAIQFERLSSNDARMLLLLRRLLVLLAFGLIHICLIWNGDILTEYALIGLIAVPFLFASNRGLAISALILFVLFAALSSLLPPSFWPTQEWMRQQVTDANHVYATGGFTDVLNFRLQEIGAILQLLIYISPRTLGLFLVGILVWRTGVLRRPEMHKRTLIWIAILGTSTGSILTFFDEMGSDPISSPLLHWVSWAIPFGPVFLSFGYASIVLLLFAFSRASHVLGIFAPLGRMAFTNYIFQSLIFGWIFYGYGLGYFGRMGAAQAFLLGLVVYVAQVLVSQWWLGRYRFGPIEWLWRTLMYGTRQPMTLPRA